MVRETRHLWVGNLPENIREDRIRDHFKRYGRVQSVKLLPRAKDDEGSGACATVSFMDIKSASKALNNEQKLEDRILTTEYHEPAAIPSSTALYSQRFSHGPSEEISGFERSSHFYERERDRDRRDGDAYLRRASSTYHVSAAEPLRGRTRDRHYRNGPYAPIIESVVSRQPSHHRSMGSSWSYDSSSRYQQPATTPDVYSDDRRDLTPVVVVHKKHTKSRSGSNGSESGSNSSSVSRSRSSSSSSQSGSSSCSSASSSPASDKSCSTHSHHGSLRSGVTLQSAVSTPHTNNSSPAVHSDDRRPLAICVRNLPARSSDTSLKDGLFHEYKKHGKVTWVKVVGQGSDRYAVVCFKKPEDVDKALQVSHDKLFFGCKIEVAPYQGYDVDDNEFRPYEAEQDEFHPKATRTLFIGNLEKDITAPELRKHFDQFGEIIEIDIKKQASNSSYAFCQYCDIGSVVRAMRTLDGEHLGNNRIKLGFGKSLHTNCVWVDGVAESVTEKYLSLQFSQFGPVSHVAIDRSRGHALVFYDQIAFAQSAVKEMRGVVVRGRKLQVDFASRECQEAFYDHLEKQTGHNTTFESVQVSPQGMTGNVTRGFETPSSSSSSSGGGTSRYPRYSAQPTITRSYSRSTVSPGASPSTPARSTPRHITTSSRFDFNAEYLPERRPYRSYEEMSMEDGGGIVTVTVGQGPQDIRHLQKERVALLEQLEDCASSGEEGSSRRRCKHRRSHSGEGSRPGTPLCDERPENLPPLEPRRTPRERPPDPLSLPLPRFATQLMSPRPAPPSPPASPPRPQSTSSDDSEPSPPEPEWEERLKSLDEKYEKWSGSRTVMAKVDTSALRVRHKLLNLDLNELQPSEIVKSVLAKRSVFDEDSKRLENFGEKYEPREFVPTRPGFTPLRPRLDSPLLHSPATPKSPVASSSPAGAKGLQYPFPSHPPVQPTTSVATTTAAISIASCSTISSGVSSASVDTSRSPQTFPTSSTTTVPAVRQFQAPTFPPLPKMSPPPSLDKKIEHVDPRLCIDKTKSHNKILPPNTSTTSELSRNEPIVTTLLKPLKSCLRRESGDDRRDSDGRRRSHDEDPKVVNILKTDCDKERDSEVIERRRSFSDPRRRDSMDSNKESLRCESASEKIKDRNHKEERRRRDSVDNSVKRDSEISDKSRLSDSRVNEHLNSADCSQFTDPLNLNISIDTRHDDNLRHTQPTDTSEKKKDSLQVCPERDRRRGRDSIENNSDSSRLRKVPESLDIKRELESDTRQKDSTEKNDSSCKKSVEYVERRKESGHSENSKNNEIFDRRKDGSISHEITRHRERKEHSTRKEKDALEMLENSRHRSSSRQSSEEFDMLRSKDERRLSHTETSKPREHSLRRDSESSEELSNKNYDKKESEISMSNRHQDLLQKKEQNCTEPLNSSIKTEDFNEMSRYKDTKRDNDSSTNSKHKENNRHNEYVRSKENHKKKECADLLHIQYSGELKKDDKSIVIKQENDEHDKESEFMRHSKQLNFEYFSHRLKDHEKRKDGDKHEPKQKNAERLLHNDSFENPKQRNYSKIDRDATNQISEWVEEIRKDLESSGYAKTRETINEIVSLDVKPRDLLHPCENYQQSGEMKKEEFEMKIKEEIKQEEESEYKENEKKKVEASDYRYFDKKNNCDTAEIFRRKEILRKKEADINNYKSKEFERIRENDCNENSRNRIGGEKKKDGHDRLKEKESTDYFIESNKQDWIEAKHADKKIDHEEMRRSKEIESSEKYYSESDSNEVRKNESENFKAYDVNHHNEEGVSKNDFVRKDKKKERLNSWPAAIGCKRRMSSQDSLEISIDETKKSKPERRDSKDSGRSSGSSKKGANEKHKSYTKLLEEKIREDKEKEMIKKRKDDEVQSENIKLASKKDKKNVEKRKDDRKGRLRHKENGITASESEAGSCDEGSKTPKRHSIFDIVDEEPAYISMYDKVKARSTKNMQKQEEEKRQERLKEKFNQLKQSRAKREEKKRSTSYDEDSDSERGGRRSNKLMITSSEEDNGSESDVRTKGRKIMSDTSEDDNHRHPNLTCIKPIRINSEESEPKPRKILSDNSEDDSLRLNIARLKAARTHQEGLEPKLRKILSDTSEDDAMKHTVIRSKPSRIQSDESENDLGYEDKKQDDFYNNKKPNDYATSDLFSNISEDPEHPSQTDIEKECNRNVIDSNISDIHRKKSHKKKQKRQKATEDADDGSSKRHNSKKDRRKSSHSHDGDDDQAGLTKIRKKKSERDNSKRDEKIEDIFGPLSDDSDKIHNKWNVSQIYGSDSEEERQIVRKREKRRKERKARELDEAGRALEAKLLENSENVSEDFTRTKKKKRKKSRDEKGSKHHQQRLGEEEAAALANEADSEREVEPPIPPPSLPRLMDSPPPSVNQNKKPDIPGFGSQVDENIHETAVKSISESPTKPVEEKREPIEDPTTTSSTEDKPTPVISQEETEDAVAALLLEDSFGGGFETYTKPDTPVSEPDLQIDTDTEDTFDPIDFSRPPRTPDIPTSFYRQQDTREGLEERILALACPDNSVNKQESENSCHAKSPSSTSVTDYNEKEIKVKPDEKDKQELDKPFSSAGQHPVATNKDEGEIKDTSKNKNSSTFETEMENKPDSLPLDFQAEVSPLSKPLFSDVKSQTSIEQSVQKISVTKVTIGTEKLSVAPQTPQISTSAPLAAQVPPAVAVLSAAPTISLPSPQVSLPSQVSTPVSLPSQISTQAALSSQVPVSLPSQITTQVTLSSQVSPPVLMPSQVQAKSMPPSIPPPLIHTTNQLSRNISGNLLSPVSVSSTSQGECPKTIQVSPSQMNHSKIYSPQEEIHKSKVLHSQAVMQSDPEKPLITKPVSQIIVTPSTTVALIVQTQSKVIQSNQQSSSVLQLSNKLHSPGNNQMELKNSGQLPQYVLHHTLQPSHLLTSQQNANKMSQQIGQPNHGATGQVHQGSHKLAVPAIPTSAKSPALPGTAKSPGLTGASKLPDQAAVQQQYKQIVLNHHPHNQQLSVNVSHSHQMSGNILLSPSQQMMYSSHSPASSHHPSTALSFSSHHVKVPVSQQQANNLHPSVLQHSPNMHHQQISPLAQKQMQHSPAIQQNTTQHISPNQLQNKSSPTLLQQVPNCVTSLPVQLCSPTKPGTIQTMRHLSPVSQPSSTNKINAHVLQPTGVQQVRAVLLQNPVKQTVTLLQPPMVQKSLGTQLIRPVNIPQPQVVHTLKNDPPVLERNRLPPPEIQLSQTVKADVVFPSSKVLSKPTEEPLPLIGSKIDDTQKVNDRDGLDFKENKKQIPLDNKSVVLENKPTNNINKPTNNVENVSSETKQTSLNKQLEHAKSVTSKPLDQVVHELHEKKQSTDFKETIKSEEKVDNVKNEIDSTGDTVEIKKDNKEVETKQEIKLENTTQLECKSEVEEVGKILSAGLEESVEHDKLESDSVLCNNAKSLESLNGINKFEKNLNKPLEEPKVEKIRIKKEENGLCIDPTPSSCTKNQTIDQTDIKTEIKAEDLKSDEILDKQDADEGEARESKEQQVTTRGGRGGRRRKAAGRAGGVVTRRARLNNTATSSSDIASADVYEFRDDSEEEANRPRLILTIKSPPDPIPPSVASQPNSASTRKSRRLQEKDGNRNTVDDTIEDVIRGTRSGSRRTTRAVANCAPIPVQTLETRKSPRRKQSAAAPPVPVIAEVKPTTVEDQPPPQPTPPQPPPLPLPLPSAEPMTLIDPVTGLLIPMRESEEGQYIPVNSDHIRSLESKEDSGEPVEKRMRTTLPTEQETSLPTRPGIPVKVPPNCAVVPPLPPKTTPKSITSSDMARPILSHSKPPVTTKTTGIVVPSGIPRPTTTLPNPVTLNKPLTIAATSLVKPPGVMMSPTGINKASVTNVVGPMTINRVVAPPPISPSSKPVMPLSASIPLNHKSHLLQAVRGKMPVAKVPTPMTPKAHILHSMGNVGREGLVGTPPPPHHGTLLTGSVASPPLRAPSQQPVVTGASSARVVCKGMLEPLKVDSGGCIVVPTASPQPHTQVMQAGLPVPAYEASMGEVVQHVNFPPHHIQPAHYVHPQLVYQQYLRDAALTGYHLSQGVKSEEEARVSPPLELRRGSPHDRTTDSPQVATVYMHGNRHLYYEPPPAHRPSQPRLQVSTPPHASQVPPQADSLLMLLQRYPVMWQGLLALKTDQAAVQMHFVFGNPHVARDSLPCNSDGSTPPLRIAQRMRLEQTQVEGVARKMQMDNEHCMLLALPCGRDHMDVLQQSNNLQSGFITYLQQKQAAGIVNIAGPGSQQAAYVVHIFPSCEFANESLARIAPDLLHRVANIAHLLIVIATV